MATYQNKAVDELFAAQKKAKIDQLNNARIAAELKIKSQVPTIKQNYNNLRSKVDTVSRMNAIGNNEVLASKGLAGGAGTAPTSGYSETSRMKDNTNLRTGLNNANTAEQGALTQVNRDVQGSNLSIEQQKANELAKIAAEKTGAQITQYNNDLGYERQTALQKQAKIDAEELRTKQNIYNLELAKEQAKANALTPEQITAKDKAVQSQLIDNYYSKILKNPTYVTPGTTITPAKINNANSQISNYIDSIPDLTKEGKDALKKSLGLTEVYGPFQFGK